MIELTSDNFEKEVLKQGGKVLVDFHAEWCGPCQMLSPILEELEPELSGDCKFTAVDIDNEQALAAEYEISSIPCLVLFENGQELDRKIGLQSAKKLTKWITK